MWERIWFRCSICYYFVYWEWNLLFLCEEVLYMYCINKGKLELKFKIFVWNVEDLSFVYFFGVVEFCKEIYDDVNNVYEYMMKGNMVVVVFDGIVVLGLGNIGFEVVLLVMEGKVVFFKSFVGVDVFLICLNMIDVDKIIEIVKLLEFIFGGVNLEDIVVFNCFEIEEWLKKEINILVFYDD